MADNVNVKNCEVLKSYSGKLVDYRDVSIASSLIVYRQASKFKEYYQNILYQTERIKNEAEERTNSVKFRYDLAFSRGLTDESRTIIGESDLTAQENYDKLCDLFDELRMKIREMGTKLDNVQEKTKTFGSQMNEMCTRSFETLKQQAELIDQYKEIK